MSGRYPRLVVNIRHFRENVEAVIRRCALCNVEITGVTKGVNGIHEITKAYIDGGVKSIGTSRLEQFEGIKEENPQLSLMLIRTPMLSEIRDVVRLTDVSLNTEIEVIKALNEEAARQNKIHGVILMTDVGDLREGFWYEEELHSAALMAENDLDNIYLAGVGTNVGCYGAIEPTVETLEKLAETADKIEKKIGRPLDIISGGASSSLMRIWDKDMPEKINHLRIGGEVMLAYTNRVVYGYDMSDLHYDAFRFQAEIVKVFRAESSCEPEEVGLAAGCCEPSGAESESAESTGSRPAPEKRMRKKAVLAVGLTDYCHTDALYPSERGVKIEAAFDDYTLMDVEDAERDYETGDILTFGLSYGALVYLTKSRSVSIEFVNAD